MEKKVAVLVGNDAAPTAAFTRHIGPEFERRGWEVNRFCGTGKPIKISESVDDMASAVSVADLVIFGMSAPQQNAEKEITVARYAVDAGKVFGFYADTFGAYQREWFSEFRNEAAFVLVLNKKEADAATLLFPRAQIVIVGNHEWEAACFPNYTREEIRLKLGIGDDTAVVFVPGHKEVTIGATLLMEVVHAVNGELLIPMDGQRKVIVIFSPHPGDGIPPQAYQAPVLYTRVPVAIVTADKMFVRAEASGAVLETRGYGFSASDVIVAADLVVESASTFCQAAALLRIPVISFLTAVSKIRNIPIFGSEDWEPVKQGISREVLGNEDMPLDETMFCLLNPGSQERRAMEEAQRLLYPGVKAKGEFARVIVNALEKFSERKTTSMLDVMD